MNWLLIVLIIFLLVKAVVGYVRGFSKKILSMLSLVAAIAVVWVIAPQIATFIAENTPLKTTVSAGLEQGILENLEETTGDNTEKIENLPLPQAIVSGINAGNDVMEMGKERLAEYVSDYMAGVVVTAVAYIGTFIIVFILIRILIKVVDLVSHIPVLKQVNGFLGLILGLLEGMIIIWLGCLIITMFAGNTQWGMDCMALIKENQILDWIYDNNFLIKIVLSIVGSL